jgi:serine/threonine protein kinase
VDAGGNDSVLAFASHAIAFKRIPGTLFSQGVILKMIEAGTLLQNRYRVLRQIGQGGMGAVYVATDERFRSTVALKQTLFDDPTLRKAFEREAHLLNHLRHAALPKVSDHFSEDSGQYLVMEFIEGSDFSELLQQRNGAYPISYVLEWADELLDALEYLHSQDPPVVHRDIKPQNLKLTTRGRVVLLDFGLAKGAQAATRASTAESVFGYSRTYAPLEQIQGTGTDARSDLYSLGATLYHLFTGTPPVDALTRAAALVNHQPDPLRPAHHAHAQVPASISKVIHRAMTQNPARRIATAAEMRVALRQASNDVSAYVSRTNGEGELDVQAAGAIDGRFETLSGIRPSAVTPTLGNDHLSVAHGETTLVDGTYAHERDDLTVEVSGRAQGGKWRHVLIGAMIALVVLSASVPVLISRRSKTLIPEGEQGAQPASVSESSQTSADALQLNGNAQTSSQRSATPTPLQPQDQAEEATAGPLPAAPAGFAATVAPEGATTSPDGSGNSTLSAGGRPTLVINEPAPVQPSGISRTSSAEDTKQADEARREQIRREDDARREQMRRDDEARREQIRRDELRRPPPGFPPPPGGFPPPRP